MSSRQRHKFGQTECKASRHLRQPADPAQCGDHSKERRSHTTHSKMHAMHVYHSDMVEVPLETHATVEPVPGRFGKLTTLSAKVLNVSNFPKILPMIYSFFCLGVYSNTQNALNDIESATETPVQQCTAPAFSLSANPKVYLVPRRPESRIIVARPTIQRTSSRLFNWIKHSVLRIPRTVRVLG